MEIPYSRKGTPIAARRNVSPESQNPNHSLVILRSPMKARIVSVVAVERNFF